MVALVDPLEVGSSFKRSEWPAHVALASNFFVNESAHRVASAVSHACIDHGPLPVRFGANVMFGRERNVSVQIVESAEIVAVHERLADLLETMVGFAPCEPAYWRDGYRPHLTHVPTLTVRRGDAMQLPFIAVARMTKSDATITSALALSATPAE